MAFPLDRMMAILQVLLEEYDCDDAALPPEFQRVSEYVEMELGRVHLQAAVSHKSCREDALLTRPLPDCRTRGDAATAPHLTTGQD